MESRSEMSGLGPLYPTSQQVADHPEKPGQPESAEKLNFYSSQRQLPGNIQQLQPARAPQTRINTGLSGLLWQLVGRSRQLRQLVQLPGARCKKPTFHQNLPFLLENLPFLLEYFRSIFGVFSGRGQKATKSPLFARATGAARFHATCFRQLEHPGKQPNSRNLCIAPPPTARRDCRPIGE